MNKQAIRDSFNSVCESTPHAVYRFDWDDAPKVTTIYNPWRDSRFGPECFDESGKRMNEVGNGLADALQVGGIKSMPIDEAERIVLESKKFYKN